MTHFVAAENADKACSSRRIRFSTHQEAQSFLDRYVIKDWCIFHIADDGTVTDCTDDPTAWEQKPEWWNCQWWGDSPFQVQRPREASSRVEVEYQDGKIDYATATFQSPTEPTYDDFRAELATYGITLPEPEKKRWWAKVGEAAWVPTEPGPWLFSSKGSARVYATESTRDQVYEELKTAVAAVAEKWGKP